MRIALLTDGGTGALGGADIYVARLAQALARRGHEVGIAFVYPGAVAEAMMHRCRDFVSEFHTVPNYSPTFRLGQLLTTLHLPLLRRRLSYDPNRISPLAARCKQRRLQQWLRRFRPDVGHIHWAGGVPMGWVASRALAACRVPIVETLHAEPTAGGKGERYRERLNARRFSHGHIVAVSEAARQAFWSHYSGPAPAASVIYCGVDQKALERSVAADDSTVTALAQQRPMLLAVGHLNRQKGIQVLIDAVARLRRTTGLKPAVRVLGEGGMRHALQNQINGLELGDQVKLVGFVANPAPWYAAADICVQCSIGSEGLPLTICEAMAIGRAAIVATDVGGIREVVRDGETGLLIPPNDPDALAAALQRLLTDEPTRLRLAGNGQALTGSMLSFSQSVDQYLQLYAEVVTAGPAIAGGRYRVVRPH